MQVMKYEGRQPLSYWVFLICGLLITSISLIAMNATQNKAIMQLFSGIGVLFLIIGGVKFFLEKGRKAEERLATRLGGVDLNRTVQNIERKYGQTNPQQQSAAQQGPQARKQPELIRCPRCQTLNYDHSNFCHMCGYRL